MAQPHELAFLILHGVESSQNVYVSKWKIFRLSFFLSRLFSYSNIVITLIYVVLLT